MAIASFIPNPHFVGKFGAFLGRADFTLFGYMFIFFIAYLFWLLYLAYKQKFNVKNSLILLGSLILFFDLLFIQSLITNKGVIGNLFVNTLERFIGVFGVVLIIFVLGSWGIFMIFEDKIFYYMKHFNFKNLDFKKLNLKIPKINIKKENKKIFKEEVKEPSFEYSLDDIALDEVNIKEPQKEIKEENLDSILKPKVKEEIKATPTKKEAVKEEIKKEDKIKEENKEEVKKEVKQKIEIKEEKKIEEKPKVTHATELEDTKKLLSEIEVGKRNKPTNWEFPSFDFLKAPPKTRKEVNEAEIDKKIKILIEKLKQFKVEGDVVRYYVGPVVTTFEFKPLPHIKVSKILALQDDLAMALKAQSIRIQAPIPGKDVVGIEIPNDETEIIYLREILEKDIFQNAKSPLTLALGKDIVGSPFVTDLAKLPHLLIAGTTGSGKSVGINAMILSLLYRNSPDELKLIMIDPKMLEFSIYNDIPHLLTPVITEPKKAITALNAMVKEMERRYKLMAKMKVKNIENYNKKSDEKMPYIVIIIDELADLMMTSGKDVEYSIARLAQMARASGIHLIVATQRPSVDVVTGLIKANLPSRISFKVGQKIDSKVILDQFGAESLLGRGDMLFTPPGITGLLRLHAPFTSEEEIEKIVEFLKSQREVEYDNTIINTIENEGLEDDLDDVDELFEEAKRIILTENKTSISYLQRRLQIGYNRAANIIEQMERKGILSPPNARGQREILKG